MLKRLQLLIILIGFPVWATLNIPLTVQEALYPGGTAGVARTNEPFCVGVPLADSASITSTSVLGLTGAVAGQFRLLGSWPDGNYKWVQVCGVLSSLSAGSTATVTLQNNGSGNFGGSNLATDNGSTITVNTGPATFTIKKGNFNVLDTITVGSTGVVSTSAGPTRGLVLYGPSPTATFPANVTCGTGTGQTPCTQATGTLYSSANDAASTCTINQNGPVMSVLRCVGSFVDGLGHVYMHYTAYETFYQNGTSVRLTVALRNADYDTSAVPSADLAGHTYNTAYKGVGSLEVRVSPTISGALSYTIAAPDTNSGDGCNGTVCTGTIGSTGTYIYQGQSFTSSTMRVAQALVAR